MAALASDAAVLRGENVLTKENSAVFKVILLSSADRKNIRLDEPLVLGGAMVATAPKHCDGVTWYATMRATVVSARLKDGLLSMVLVLQQQ